MAPSNAIASLQARLEARYEAANATADHDEAKSFRELKELLLEKHLPFGCRFMANSRLAWNLDSWSQREHHRLGAEKIFGEMCAVISIEELSGIGKRHYDVYRLGLDALAAYQRGENIPQAFLELRESLGSSSSTTDRLQEEGGASR